MATTKTATKKTATKTKTTKAKQPAKVVAKKVKRSAQAIMDIRIIADTFNLESLYLEKKFAITKNTSDYKFACFERDCLNWRDEFFGRPTEPHMYDLGREDLLRYKNHITSLMKSTDPNFKGDEQLVEAGLYTAEDMEYINKGKAPTYTVGVPQKILDFIAEEEKKKEESKPKSKPKAKAKKKVEPKAKTEPKATAKPKAKTKAKPKATAKTPVKVPKASTPAKKKAAPKKPKWDNGIDVNKLIKDSKKTSKPSARSKSSTKK